MLCCNRKLHADTSTLVRISIKRRQTGCGPSATHLSAIFPPPKPCRSPSRMQRTSHLLFTHTFRSCVRCTIERADDDVSDGIIFDISIYSMRHVVLSDVNDTLAEVNALAEHFSVRSQVALSRSVRSKLIVCAIILESLFRSTRRISTRCCLRRSISRSSVGGMSYRTRLTRPSDSYL